MTNHTVAAFLARSNRLSGDRRNTNYAGGNTSAKGVETDPVTRDSVELLWVNGSGCHFGALKWVHPVLTRRVHSDSEWMAGHDAFPGSHNAKGSK